MPGKKHSYKHSIKSNMLTYIVKRQAEKILQSNKRISIGEIERDISDYCQVTPYIISHYKMGKALPSLAVAFKLAKYFDCKVDDLFFMEEGDEIVK